MGTWHLLIKLELTRARVEKKVIFGYTSTSSEILA